MVQHWTINISILVSDSGGRLEIETSAVKGDHSWP